MACKEGMLLNFVCSEVNLASVPRHTWWIDSGAKTHISVSMQGCLNYRKPNDGERYIYVDDGKSIEARPYRPNEKKLDSWTISCYLIGYSERSRGYKFYDPMTKSILETSNGWFFEDVKFAGGERLKDFVFEEEHVDIPLIAMDNDQEQFHIPNIVQEATLDQDNVIDPHTQPQEVVLEEQTLQPKKPLPLRMSTRESRNTILDYYNVFL
ncbi:hypothetical protein GH714_032187 [Hevea brasiliensis]|uniref:Retroviral polymerase SH3-like domain-containing protein n=1 Tax=Hevea brasiliensis TaxID=3981 RepID=A0A6A6L3H9_HEVBR|nr:hypothetical protein GH714_032187 [Hevea brasiliensis]